MLVLRDVEDGQAEDLEREAREGVEALWHQMGKPAR